MRRFFSVSSSSTTARIFDFAKQRLPIWQAPMAGGFNTPALAAAVIRSGGVGGFGFAYSTPEQIDSTLAAVAEVEGGPVNANFFIFDPIHTPPSAEEHKAAADSLSRLPFCQEHPDGIRPLEPPAAPYFPDLDRQLEAVWKHRPAILSFHFGIPRPHVVEQAHSLGITVGVTATNAEEATAVEAAGVDFVVAQSREAGGHQGTFSPRPTSPALALDSLLPQVVKSVSVPVVAAGGLMSGADVARARRMGAAAAQLGTAFLCCDEAGTSGVHRQYLLHEQGRKTALTAGFSGRMARGIENEFITEMAKDESSTLPFPLQNTLTKRLRQEAGRRQSGEYQSLWAGVNFPAVRAAPAKELMEQLAEELRVALLSDKD